jgi:hypothetical protein
MVMKGTAFSDMTQCSQLKCNRRFEGTFRIHLHGRKIRQGINQLDAGIWPNEPDAQD